MNTIKEFANKRVVLRTNTYGHSLAFFDELFTEAKKDFPALKRDDIEVVEYGGDRIKRTFGIEFNAKSEIPETYQEIREMHPTL